jgi:hypothetical protein
MTADGGGRELKARVRRRAIHHGRCPRELGRGDIGEATCCRVEQRMNEHRRE